MTCRAGTGSSCTTAIPFVEGSIVDTELMERTLREHDVEGVVHLAGYKYAGVSVDRPLHTYTQNVTGTISLLEAMERTGVGQDGVLLERGHLRHPRRGPGHRGDRDPPGVAVRREQADRRVADPRPGPCHEACGTPRCATSTSSARGRDDLYDTSPHNLFPIVFEKLLRGETPRINGDDYATPDGTCVRDYVHVGDLAAAHVVAAQRLSAGDALQPVYNLGSGTGYSVAEIMDAIRTVTGIDFTPEIGPRRPGDPARIVATGEAAARDLGWKMRHDLDDMVRSAWQARSHAR